MKRIYTIARPILLYVILLFYIFILAKILLFKYISPFELFNPGRLFTRTFNIIPAKSTIEYFFSSFSLKIALMNVAGNIIIFIPAGIYLQLFKKDKRIIKSVGIVLLISLFVEITQYIFAIGASDIDDIILNVLGGFIGAIIYNTAALFFKDEYKTKTAITACSTIIGMLCLILIIRYYPQMFGIQKHYAIVTTGEEFAVNDNNSDILGQFISFNDGILTVKNGTGINNRPDKYGAVEISVKIGSGAKMAKKAVNYNFSPHEILVTYSNFTYEEFKTLGKEDNISFNIDIANGEWIAKDICVMLAKDNQ